MNSMRLPVARIILLAVVIEAVAIAILFALVAISGARDPVEAQAYAEHMGQFVGPIAGALLCFLGAWWLARRTSRREVLCGFLVGAAAVAIDLALLFPLGGRLNWLITASNTGRLIAGTLGGYLGRAR